MYWIRYVLVLALGAAARADAPSLPPAEQKLHDPLAEAAAASDDVAKQVLAALTRYDCAALQDAITVLETRSGKPQAGENDDYFLAQAKLGLLAIKRFFEVDLPDSLPPELTAIELDATSDSALTIAERFAKTHPDHSDIHRVIGELWSAKIRGMTGGMTLGPKARDAIEKALAIDDKNALAWLGQARMHYHNPAFVGGDKDLALIEFRRVSEDTGHIRACLYLARIHRDKDLFTQARFFAKKALRISPSNPEAKFLLDDSASRAAAKEQNR